LRVKEEREVRDPPKQKRGRKKQRLKRGLLGRWHTVARMASNGWHGHVKTKEVEDGIKRSGRKLPTVAPNEKFRCKQLHVNENKREKKVSRVGGRGLLIKLAKREGKESLLSRGHNQKERNNTGYHGRVRGRQVEKLSRQTGER